MGHSWSEIPRLEDLVVRFLGLSCCPKSESKSDSPTQGKPLPEEPPPRLPAWVLGALGRLRKLEHLRVGNRWPLSASASQRRTEVGGLFFSRPPGPWMDSPNETNERGGGRRGAVSDSGIKARSSALLADSLLREPPGKPRLNSG